MKKSFFKYSAFTFFAFLLLNIAFSGGCGVYSFADVSIPDSIKTVKVNFFENKAQYVNPQLSPTLTDRFRQKVVNQTKLSQTNSDNAHYIINGYISNYTITTSGVTSTQGNQRQASMNNLNVGVHVSLTNTLDGKVQEFDISRSFPFSATLTLQAAESQLQDEMVRNLSDEIFNRIFSNW